MDRGKQVMAEFWDVFNKRIWLDSVKMKASLSEYNPSEIHCIEGIANSSDSNVTKLAETYHMTKSAISKLTKKLIQKGLVESYRKPDNKKEIYFKLTEQGMAVNRIHEELHREYKARDQIILEQITEEQFKAMHEFAQLYNKHLDSEIEKLGDSLQLESYNNL